jgi:hypothetical protein
MKTQTPRITGIVLAAGLVTASLCWTFALSDRTAFAANASAGAPARLGGSIAGTWISNPRPAPVWATAGFQLLMNINEGGTLIWSHNFEYGAFGLRKDSAVYGSWTQTGPLEITSREVGFLYNTAGAHQETGRVTTVYTFSPDFQTFTAQGTEDVFLPHQDLTDPNQVPVRSFGVVFTAKRLNPPS